MPILHTHIEKVGGTTVIAKYMEKYGAGKVWRYSGSERDNPAHYRSLGNKIFSITDPRQRELRAQIFRNFPRLAHLSQSVLNALPGRKPITLQQALEIAEVITGHFAISEVTDTLNPLDQSRLKYRTVIRHPLDRMLSHYYYLHQNEVPAVRTRVPELRADGLSFEEFALHPLTKNYQSQVVGPNPEQYEIIGVTDYLDDFLVVAGLQKPGDIAPVVNKGRRRINTSLSPEFISRFEKFHAEDYELYKKILRQWQPGGKFFDNRVN